MRSASCRLVYLTLAGILGTASQAHSTTVLPLPPRELAHLAASVFAGTVTSTTPDSAAGGTRVVFRDLKFVKGAAGADSATLVLFLPWGEPTFDRGSRYIVFTARPLEGGAPLNSVLDLDQGQFRVVPAQGDRPEHVVSDEHAVVGLAANRVTLLCPDYYEPSSVPVEPSVYGNREIVPKRRDPGTRLTENEFLDTVRGFLR